MTISISSTGVAGGPHSPLKSGPAAPLLALLASERTRLLVAWMLLAVNVILLAAYLFGSYRGFFHSDSSVKNLLAEEMHATSSFFPPGWNYVNKDLMVLFGQVGVWALMFFFDNTYTLYAIASMVVAGLILMSAWWFTGLLDCTRWQRLLAVAVLAGGISANVSEDMFGQAAYGMVAMFTCLVAVLAWKGMDNSPRRRTLALGMLFALLVLVTWSNPQRAAASYMLPLFCGFALYVWGAGSMVRLRACLPVIGTAVAGFGIGAVLSRLSLAQVNNNTGAGAARWLDFAGMASNLVDTFHALIGLLGGLPAVGGDVLSLAGIYAALRLLAALVLLVLVTRRIVALCGSLHDRARFVGGLVASTSLCFLFLQITTTVPDMTEPVSAARYLTPMLVLGVMLVICSPLKSFSHPGTLLVVLVSGLLATSSLLPFNPGSMISPAYQNVQRDALVAELKSMELKYGYATYWNAGALTVLSDNEVKVRQVLIQDGLPRPMRHLSSDRWFEPEAWQGETFLLLDDREAALIDWSAITRYAGAPVREARIGGMQVFVFKQNLSAGLPNWSSILREPYRIPAGPDSAKMVGRWDAAAGALRTGFGDAGFLQFGPYRFLGRGSYQVTYDVSGTSHPAGQVVATVDVVANSGATILASTEVHADGTQQQTLRFDLQRSVSDLEIRVRATGTGEVAYKGVTLSTHR